MVTPKQPSASRAESETLDQASSRQQRCYWPCLYAFTGDSHDDALSCPDDSHDDTDIHHIVCPGWMTGSSCPPSGPRWVCAASTTTSSGSGAPGSWRTGSHTTSRPWSPPTTSSRPSSASGSFGKQQDSGSQVLCLSQRTIFYTIGSLVS